MFFYDNRREKFRGQIWSDLSNVVIGQLKLMKFLGYDLDDDEMESIRSDSYEISRNDKMLVLYNELGRIYTGSNINPMFVQYLNPSSAKSTKSGGASILINADDHQTDIMIIVNQDVTDSKLSELKQASGKNRLIILNWTNLMANVIERIETHIKVTGDELDRLKSSDTFNISQLPWMFDTDIAAIYRGFRIGDIVKVTGLNISSDGASPYITYKYIIENTR